MIFRITTTTSDCGYEAVEAAFFGLHGNAAKRAMRRIGRPHNISISGSVLRVSTPWSKICEYLEVFLAKTEEISLCRSLYGRISTLEGPTSGCYTSQL